jgi:hypothetical protein
MYAGMTIEICALEKFVHLGGSPHPPLVLVAIDVPDDENQAYRPSLSALPLDWAGLPTPASTQEFGRLWIASARAADVGAVGRHSRSQQCGHQSGPSGLPGHPADHRAGLRFRCA